MLLSKKLFFTILYWFNPPWDTNQTPPELIDFIDNTPPGRALDLGCGTGTNVITLATQGWQVTGIDFIPKAIRTARQKTTQAGISADLKVSDVTKLDSIHDTFDLIIDIGCYHSLEPKGMQDYRENIRRLLKPGGTFMLYLFFRDEDSNSSSGAIEADLHPFETFLELTKREDGTERDIRKSSWLWYKKPSV